MTWPADGTLFAFFGADSPLSIHCFDCSFVSGVKWSIHVSSMVMNRPKKSASLLWNIAKHSIEISSRHCFVLLWLNAAPISHTAFSCLNFQSICDVQHFLKCLPCLLTRALLVDGHQISFCRFSSPFLSWLPHLVDHSDMFVLAARTPITNFSHVYKFTESVQY